MRVISNEGRIHLYDLDVWAKQEMICGPPLHFGMNDQSSGGAHSRF